MSVAKKRILILSASFGEGHNSAARGIRDGLTRIAPQETEIELRDLFAEAYGPINELVRRSYLAVVNYMPAAWGAVYQWLDRKKDFEKEFRRFKRLNDHLAGVVERFRPHVVVSCFPAYPHVLQQILGSKGHCKNIVAITDSITVNAVWFRGSGDFFLAPNEQSAAVLRTAGVAPEKIKTFGFPVSPKFADLTKDRQLPSSDCQPRVLYMIHHATLGAPGLVRQLAGLGIDLTVTIGRAKKLRPAIEEAAGRSKTKIVGWTDDLPRMLRDSHLLIGKAGGATVQETIAAGCPMIINHVVAGQEEGNARLIVETNSGVVAGSRREVIAQVQHAFANDAKQWREWAGNISRLSRPRASLDIAEFLMSL
jgi:processive 1,2-diacylglycerol beta-glucosyltransferase